MKAILTVPSATGCIDVIIFLSLPSLYISLIKRSFIIRITPYTSGRSFSTILLGHFSRASAMIVWFV